MNFFGNERKVFLSAVASQVNKGHGESVSRGARCEGLYVPLNLTIFGNLISTSWFVKIGCKLDTGRAAREERDARGSVSL